MKRNILLIIGAFSGLTIVAQNKIDIIEEKRPINNIFVTLLGDASLVSINYEKLFSLSSSCILVGKLGAGYHGNEYKNGSISSVLTIPHHLTCNFGKKSLMAELGIGGTLFSANNYRPYALYPIAGFRIQPPLPMMVNFRFFVILPVGGFHGFAHRISPVGLSLGVSF